MRLGRSPPVPHTFPSCSGAQNERKKGSVFAIIDVLAEIVRKNREITIAAADSIQIITHPGSQPMFSVQCYSEQAKAFNSRYLKIRYNSSSFSRLGFRIFPGT